MATVNYDKLERDFVMGTIARIAKTDPEYAAKIRAGLAAQGLSGWADALSTLAQNIASQYATSSIQNRMAIDAAKAQAKIMSAQIAAQAKANPPIAPAAAEATQAIESYSNRFDVSGTPVYLWAALAGGVGLLAYMIIRRKRK